MRGYLFWIIVHHMLIQNHYKQIFKHVLVSSLIFLSCSLGKMTGKRAVIKIIFLGICQGAWDGLR